MMELQYSGCWLDDLVVWCVLTQTAQCPQNAIKQN